MMQFNLESTIEQLEFYICDVEVSAPVKKISEIFEKNSKLPGVVLLENDNLLGLLSRANFLQYMSRPYSLEIAAKRSIKSLLGLIEVQNFILPKNVLIIEAVKKSLKRIPELMSEPIIMMLEEGKYGIIDAHNLLVAHSAIQEYTCELVTQMYCELDAVKTKLEKTNRKLKYLARVDDLTQVANRRVFGKYLEREWQRGETNKLPLAVIMCAVDYFSEYNNQYGALAGDYCLQNIAQLIKDILKTRENLIARYDGNKFAIAIPNTDAIAAAAIAENIRCQVQKLAIEHSQSQVSKYLTVSLGVASLLPSSEKFSDALILAANSALTRAKTEGKNRKIIWNNKELNKGLKLNSNDKLTISI